MPDDEQQAAILELLTYRDTGHVFYCQFGRAEGFVRAIFNHWSAEIFIGRKCVLYMDEISDLDAAIDHCQKAAWYYQFD